MKYCKIWTIKGQVIVNSRLIKSLSYFKSFKAIYQDKNTLPKGYFIEFFVK